MMKRKIMGVLWVWVLLLGAACSQEYGMPTSSTGTTDETDDSSTVSSEDFESTVAAALAANCASHEAATDYVWQAAEAIPITLNGSAITVGGQRGHGQWQRGDHYLGGDLPAQRHAQ